MHSMNKNTYLWVNFVAIIIPIVTMFWVYPIAFLDEQVWAFGCMLLMFLLVFGINLYVWYFERFDVAKAGFNYLFMMEISMLLQKGYPLSAVVIFLSILVCVLFAVASFVIAKWDEEVDKEARENQEEQDKTGMDLKDLLSYDTVSFGRPLLDERFKLLVTAIQNLSPHAALFENDIYRNIEQTLDDLQFISTHFQELQEEKREAVENQIHVLFACAEEQVGALKTIVDDWHISEIRKRSQSYEKMS